MTTNATLASGPARQPLLWWTTGGTVKNAGADGDPVAPTLELLARAFNPAPNGVVLSGFGLHGPVQSRTAPAGSIASRAVLLPCSPEGPSRSPSLPSAAAPRSERTMRLAAECRFTDLAVWFRQPCNDADQGNTQSMAACSGKPGEAMKKEAQQGPSASTAAQPEQRPHVSVERHAKMIEPTSPLAPLSDADRYQWIRANRGNFDIVNALDHSHRDADFDAHIDAAIRLWKAGRHRSCGLGDLNRWATDQVPG